MALLGLYLSLFLYIFYRPSIRFNKNFHINILIITYLKHILPLKYQFLVVVFKCNSFQLFFYHISTFRFCFYIITAFYFYLFIITAFYFCLFIITAFYFCLYIITAFYFYLYIIITLPCCF